VPSRSWCDLSIHTADGSWDLSIPATFVIDRSGIVRARYVSADYTTRMDPDDIEAALAAFD
jgi:peroxiredoxin